MNRQTIMPQAKQLSSKGSKAERGSLMPSSMMGLGMDRKHWLDTLDCSKPDKFLREIFEFLKIRAPSLQVTLNSKTKADAKLQFSQLSFHKKHSFSTMSGNDALILINELTKCLFDPRLHKHGPPAFKPDKVNQFFQQLRYPYDIRADAITAVGAPSTIGFLVRAIYWLYLTARVDCLNVAAEPSMIEESPNDNERPDKYEGILRTALEHKTYQLEAESEGFAAKVE